MNKKSSQKRREREPETQRPELWIEPVQGPGDLECAFAIREIAFIEEQRVAPDIERDAADAHAFHVLAYAHGHAVGTGRLVQLDAPPEGTSGGRWGRIGRIAVMQSSRGKGLAHRILGALEAEAARRGIDTVLLHAQTWLRQFYERTGYEAVGESFEEAGLPHIRMVKRLDVITEAQHDSGEMP
ncbi:MAG: GNAT family N-acetyltransferase [Myxococcales bacterium]|nr:GNAT family N-acetyltransferase [Myxococcales bacterium]